MPRGPCRIVKLRGPRLAMRAVGNRSSGNADALRPCRRARAGAGGPAMRRGPGPLRVGSAAPGPACGGVQRAARASVSGVQPSASASAASHPLGQFADLAGGRVHSQARHVQDLDRCRAGLDGELGRGLGVGWRRGRRGRARSGRDRPALSGVQSAFGWALRAVHRSPRSRRSGHQCRRRVCRLLALGQDCRCLGPGRQPDRVHTGAAGRGVRSRPSRPAP
jgi:hypothetical protein